MITKNTKYQVECDYCRQSSGWNTKKSILKHFVIYQNVVNGDVGHFCCEQCARKYIRIKKLGLNFVRVTNTKNINGASIDVINNDELRQFEEIKNKK